jgi:hypothetical protein
MVFTYNIIVFHTVAHYVCIPWCSCLTVIRRVTTGNISYYGTLKWASCCSICRLSCIMLSTNAICIVCPTIQGFWLAILTKSASMDDQQHQKGKHNRAITSHLRSLNTKKNIDIGNPGSIMRRKLVHNCRCRMWTFPFIGTFTTY